VPERTCRRTWQPPGDSGIIDGVIHHADAALEAWLGGLDGKVEVTFEPSDDAPSTSRRSTSMSMLLAAVREQTTKRNTETRDVRDDEGRVIERQRATRYFELDYVCRVTGPHPDAHEQLGRVLQLMVDHDVVPAEHLPAELADLDEPVEVCVVAPSTPIGSSGAALTIRVIVPVRPTPVREIAEPAVELHLDMAPAPGRTAASPTAPRNDSATEPVPDRQWTTVRRRERITPVADDDEAAAS
jgi:hypothetical protein